MSEKTNIDKIVREKFENFSVEPPVHLWSGISGQLEARRKKNRLAYIGWISAAAVVAIAFVAGWLLNDHSKHVVQAVAEQPKSEITVTPKTEIKSGDVADLSVEENTQDLIEESKTSIYTTNKVASLTLDKHQSVQDASVYSGKTVQRYSLAELKSKKAEFSTDDFSVLAEAAPSKNNEKVLDLSENDRMIVAANSQMVVNDNKKEDNWAVGAYLSPGYAAHTSSYSATYSQNMGSNATGGVNNLGGGISVQYKTGKRWSVESGVYYAQNTQSAGSTGNLKEMSFYYDQLNGLNGSDNLGYANTVDVEPGLIAMNSTAGVVAMASAPQGSELLAIADAGNIRMSATLTGNGTFSQEFDFVEIPLYLRYHLLDKKFGVDLIGGINAGWVVGNNAYLSNDYGKQYIGTTDDISVLNVLGTVGVGLSYDLSKRFSLAFEPRLNYFLNSISTNPDVVYRPYRFGLFTGIYYQF